jgi:hypothetical protein
MLYFVWRWGLTHPDPGECLDVFFRIKVSSAVLCSDKVLIMPIYSYENQIILCWHHLSFAAHNPIYHFAACSAFLTVELPKEAAARSRRRARDQAKAGTSKESTASSATPGSQSKQRKKKRLNLSTYKAHSLGDYVRTIRIFGTTDSYSTQTVSFTVHPQYGIWCSIMIGRAWTSSREATLRTH